MAMTLALIYVSKRDTTYRLRFFTSCSMRQENSMLNGHGSPVQLCCIDCLIDAYHYYLSRCLECLDLLYA